MKKLPLILLLVAFISCKKEQKNEPVAKEANTVETQAQDKSANHTIFDITKCFQAKYIGSFMGEGKSIVMNLESVVKEEGYNYKVTGKTNHQGSEVPFTGTLKLDEKMASEDKIGLKFSYLFNEAAVENGSGKFSGYAIVELPRKGDMFLYDDTITKFIGNYFFADGKQAECNFGSNK